MQIAIADVIQLAGLLIAIVTLWISVKTYMHAIGRKSADQAVALLLIDTDKAGFRRLQHLAAKGSPNAQYNLGKLYLTGRFFPPNLFIKKDENLALLYIYKAASQGHDLALQYLQAYGASKSRNAATQLTSARLEAGWERLKLWTSSSFLLSYLATFFLHFLINSSAPSLKTLIAVVGVSVGLSAALSLIRSIIDKSHLGAEET
jgi:hypothetical protein